MKYLKIIIMAFIIVVPATAGAIIPAAYKLSGSGEIRYLGFIKVYDAALFTPESVSRQKLLDAESSRCLQLLYDVDLKADDFVEAATIVLSEQHDEQTLASVQPEIELLHRNYQAVTEGDSYTLCYDAGTQQTRLALNNDVLITIQSAEFAEIYFGIWLGEKNPLSNKLRGKLVAGLTGNN